ncbi:MAG: nucleotide exchange factor GrpE [Actinobacteria bacterium]|nr:nucleotide exchange factor GrpE [Actinomycetota bacterium]
MRPEEESQGPVIRDLRRIDPVTGQVRDTGAMGGTLGSAPTASHARGRHAAPRGGPSVGSGSSSNSGGPGAGSGSGGSPGDARSGTGPGSWPGGGLGGSQGGAQGGASSGAGQAGAAGSQQPSDAAAKKAEAAAAEATSKLAERTADLQRLQAEYSNYRKRVERDRMAVREQALANVLGGLIPVLDDIGRAREHGELTGGFKSVGESLEATTAKLGLTAFGEPGDPFDPTLHEALTHAYSADVKVPTAVQVFQPGYKVGERIIRPARVAVAEPGGAVELYDGKAPASASPEGSAAASSGAGAVPGDANPASQEQPGTPPRDADN